ncbi:MAG: hypothetical protein LBJ15_00810 [Comamonas sp.]|jgi:hypothetical protein|uniref:hypothetical protein n=1 Tax=Comamonas sp. TaxID=34028 RepID=UPI00282833C2|nr:hypothetical protein [Comamonas sp.]MDR0212527.1 hypothetical protein [Comamonas sp.]
MHQVPNTSAAQTDVSAFITDLDGGQFDRMLSIALGQVAAGAVDNNKVGEVDIKLKLKRIPGTHQVTVEHHLKFIKPTADGKSSEEATRKTVMHVGKNGVMSLTPPNQLSIPGIPAKA